MYRGGTGSTAIRSGEGIMQFKDYFLDEVRYIAVSRAVKRDCPLMGVRFVYVWWRIFDVG
jgi:hypothetical protein